MLSILVVANPHVMYFLLSGTILCASVTPIYEIRSEIVLTKNLLPLRKGLVRHLTFQQQQQSIQTTKSKRKKSPDRK